MSDAQMAAGLGRILQIRRRASRNLARVFQVNDIYHGHLQPTNTAGSGLVPPLLLGFSLDSRLKGVSKARGIHSAASCPNFLAGSRTHVLLARKDLQHCSGMLEALQ